MKSESRRAFIAALFVTSLLFPSANAQTPVPLPVTTPVIGGHAEGGSIDDRYRFDAGPGDFTVAVEATTNYYSHAVEVKLLSTAGVELGNINLVASDSTGRASRSFHTPSHRGFVLTIHADHDASVKQLDYKVTLSGAVDAAQGTTDQSYVPPVTSTGDPVSSPQVVVPVSATPSPKGGGNPAAFPFAQMLSGLETLPSTGFLRIEMKDGTNTLIDLARVKGLSYVQQ